MNWIYIVWSVMLWTTADTAFRAPVGAAEKASRLVIGETFTIDSKIMGETRRGLLVSSSRPLRLRITFFLFSSKFSRRARSLRGD